MEDSGPSIDITLDHSRLKADELALRELLTEVARGQGHRIESLSVVLTDHETVLDLNRRYLEHDYHTDVLSFHLGEETDSGEIVGEIYVDLDMAAERHVEYGASFEEEVFRYAIHGLLHLMGHDDATPEGAAEMRRLEDFYLRKT